MSYNKNLENLKLAMNLLGELADELVFVGGATACLYVNPKIGEDIRPTEDVDCVVETYSRSSFNDMEKRLRQKGFVNDTRKDAPICRFLYKELLTLDLMPDDKSILGFSNSWYRQGIKEKITKKIDGKEISIFSLPFFLASKFEAHEGRGSDDPRFSSDLEDIVIVLDGIDDFSLEVEDKKVIKYLSKMADSCLSDRKTKEAIEGFLPTQARLERFLQKLELIKHNKA